MSYWANFARTGNPNSAGTELEWKKFEAMKRNFIRFDFNKIESLDNFRDKYSAAWLNLVTHLENLDYETEREKNN